MYDVLRKSVLEANLAIVSAGLVTLTWGNVSAADRERGVMAIKPSGVPYNRMTSQDMVVVDIESGEVVAGDLRPSSDTPTHLHLYRCFTHVGAVVHTHSRYGTSCAQARIGIPCLGTTHADNFDGPIPCTRMMSPSEITTDYELNTGRVIEETFTSLGIDAEAIPGVLVAGHAPFAWGTTASMAVENAIVLELTAEMFLHAQAISPNLDEIPAILRRKHFNRKHGEKAYYGQKHD